MNKNLALFDFDGTITREDTFLELIKFSKGTTRFYFGMAVLSPVLFLYKINVLANWRAKEITFSYFFKHENVEAFKQMCHRFSTLRLPHLIRPSALEKIKEHIINNDHVVIVSASSSWWISGWSNAYNIQLITTQWEVSNNKITGKINGYNCYGPVKRDLIKATLDIKSYAHIYAYGDTSGDREMLALTPESYYKYFTD